MVWKCCQPRRFRISMGDFVRKDDLRGIVIHASTNSITIGTLGHIPQLLFVKNQDIDRWNTSVPSYLYHRGNSYNTNPSARLCQLFAKLVLRNDILYDHVWRKFVLLYNRHCYDSDLIRGTMGISLVDLEDYSIDIGTSNRLLLDPCTRYNTYNAINYSGIASRMFMYGINDSSLADVLHNMAVYNSQNQPQEQASTPPPEPVIKQSKVYTGWELEATESDINADEYGIEQKEDGSVNGDGLEYVSPKQGLVESMKLLKKVLSDSHVVVNKSCGFHTHISLSSDEFKLRKNISRHKARFLNNLMALGKIYQERLYKVAPESRRSGSYSHPLSQCKANVRKMLGTLSSRKYVNNKRYEWINFTEMYRSGGLGTVEFRILGNTKRFEYILSFTVFYALLVYHAYKMHVTSSPDSLLEAFADLDMQLSQIERVKPSDYLLESAVRQQFINQQMKDLECLEIKFTKLYETEVTV